MAGRARGRRRARDARGEGRRSVDARGSRPFFGVRGRSLRPGPPAPRPRPVPARPARPVPRGAALPTALPLSGGRGRGRRRMWPGSAPPVPRPPPRGPDPSGGEGVARGGRDDRASSPVRQCKGAWGGSAAAAETPGPPLVPRLIGSSSPHRSPRGPSLSVCGERVRVPGRGRVGVRRTVGAGLLTGARTVLLGPHGSLPDFGPRHHLPPFAARPLTGELSQPTPTSGPTGSGRGGPGRTWTRLDRFPGPTRGPSGSHSPTGRSATPGQARRVMGNRVQPELNTWEGRGETSKRGSEYTLGGRETGNQIPRSDTKGRAGGPDSTRSEDWGTPTTEVSRGPGRALSLP